VTAEPERSGPPPAAPTGPVVFKGEIPPKALVHIRHLLAAFPAAPYQTGLSTGMFEQATEVRRHAEFVRDSVRGNDLDGVKRHAEHIVNMVEGEKGPNYGDLNKDGKVQNPGDGYGLLENGDQLGYLKGVVDHARLAAQTDDANETIRVHSGHVQIAAENVQGFAASTRDLARELLEIPTAPGAEAKMQQVLAQADRALNGVDLNNNEQIEPIKGEAGSKIGYQHSQFMAIMTINAVQPAVAGAAPAAAGALTLDMTDNQFSLKSVTVPVGTTITWTNKSTGRRHSATADNGSFDTELLDSGKSGSATLATPGTFAYYCKLHGGPGGQGMAATIVVEGSGPAAAVGSPPPTQAAVLPTTPPAPKPAAPAPPAPPTVAPAPPAAPAAPAGPVAVDIVNFAFSQKNLTVKVGTSVTWTNKDRAPHTVTADGKQFDSGNLTNGQAFTNQASQAGTFPYYCEIHGGPGGQGMSGTVTVTP
jgi:plastocyanin